MWMEYSEDCRKQIFDKTKGHCGYCGRILIFHNYGIVHPNGAWIIAKTNSSPQGGTDYNQDAIPICIICNREKQYLNDGKMKVPDVLKGLEQYCTRAKVIDIVPELAYGKLVYEQDITLELPNGKKITYWERTENMFEASELGKYYHFLLSMDGVSHTDGVESAEPDTFLLSGRYIAGRIEKIAPSTKVLDQIICNNNETKRK
jgi:hypothetical protein